MVNEIWIDVPHWRRLPQGQRWSEPVLPESKLYQSATKTITIFGIAFNLHVHFSVYQNI